LRKITIILVLAMSIVFVGCEAANVVGEQVEYANACDADNDKKVIETSGYLDSGIGLYCSSTGGRMECGFKLKKNLDDDEKGFTADVAIGSGANTMDKLDGSFEKADIKVRNIEGKEIDLTKKVKITGKLNSSKDVVSKDLVCYLKVLKIEQ